MSSQVKNRLLLPVLFFLTLTAFIYLQNNWLLVVLAVLFWFICCIKSWPLIGLTLLCSFFIGIRTSVYCQNLQDRSEFSKEQVLTLKTIPDTIKINGDQLQFKAFISAKKQYVQATYTLKEPSEKHFWSNCTHSLTLKIKGTLTTPTKARNLKGFNFQSYYHSQKINQQARLVNYQIISKNQRDLAAVRRSLILNNKNNFPKRIAAYLNALILGYKDQEFQERAQAYQSHGLLHLFSLSGLHVHIYLGMVELLLKRLKYLEKTRFLCLSGISYVLIALTGQSIAIQRAIISYLLSVLLSVKKQRLSAIDRWSIVTGVLCLLYPLLIFSTSGRLSLGIAYLLIYLKKQDRRTHSLVLSLLMIPTLIFEFSEWPLISGMINIFMIPLFSLILPVIVILFLGSCIFHWPSTLLKFVESGIIKFEGMLKSFEFTIIKFGKPNVLVFIILLVGVAILCHLIWYRRKKACIVGFLGLLCCCFLISQLSPGIVAFVDVGQGDSIFIKLPLKKETFLIDTGGRMQFQVDDWKKRKSLPPSEYNLVPFLKSQGCQKLDHVIVTHNDQDHMGELLNVSRQIKIKNLYLGKGAQFDPKMQKVLKKIPQTTKLHQIKRGDQIGSSQKFLVLAPEISDGTNDNSLVLTTAINGKRFLFTGDLEETGEKKLIKDYPNLKTDILKVGHHGSNTSTSPEFLEQVNPQEAIISAGLNNRYGHPTEETLSKLKNRKINILRTDQQGMIYYQWWFNEKLSAPKTALDFSQMP